MLSASKAPGPNHGPRVPKSSLYGKIFPQSVGIIIIIIIIIIIAELTSVC